MNEKFEIELDGNLVAVADEAARYAVLNILAASKVDEAAMSAYLKNECGAESRDEDYIENFHEVYVGDYDSPKDFAEQFEKDTNAEVLESIPPNLRSCIDWEKYWDTDLMYSYWNEGRYFFRNM